MTYRKPYGPREGAEMVTNSYRLDEYKIIESNTGELTWEAHRGFGGLQKGRCFRKGGILFIGPLETDEPGFLKREFLEHLKPLPAWSKTKHYCVSFEIHHCKTHKRVTKPEMTLWMLDKNDNGAGRWNENPDAVYRLLRYELTVKPTGEILWKTPMGPTAVSSGTCIISEDILLIGPKQSIETGVSRRRFVSNLKRLPKWDQTAYYSTKISLRNCYSAVSESNEQKTWAATRRTEGKHRSGKRTKRDTDAKLTASTLWKARAGLFSRGVKKSTRCICNLTGSSLSQMMAHSIALKNKWYQRKGKVPSG